MPDVQTEDTPQGPQIVMLPPDSAERELIGILEPRIDEIQSILENVVKQFALIQGRADAEEDIDAEDRVRFADRLKELREAFNRQPRGMNREAQFLSDMVRNAAREFFAKKSLKDRVLDQVAKQVDHFAFSQIERGMQLLLSPAFQIHVSPRGGRVRLQREFVSRVGTLTASIETNMFRQVRNALVGGIQEGQSLSELLASVGKSAAESKIRARLIARSEVGLLNFGVNKFIQQAIGIKKYRWITEDDEKVRPRHKLRHKRIYSWTFQHSDGHPGVPPNCRCVASPIVPLELRATFLAPENRLRIQIREPLRPPFLGSRRRLHTIADVSLGDIPIIGPLFNPLG